MNEWVEAIFLVVLTIFTGTVCFAAGYALRGFEDQAEEVERNDREITIIGFDSTKDTTIDRTDKVDRRGTTSVGDTSDN